LDKPEEKPKSNYDSMNQLVDPDFERNSRTLTLSRFTDFMKDAKEYFDEKKQA
jgi:hypothetical protein